MNKEDYNKYYIQGSDHYLIPKDVFMELFNEMESWREENKILRKNAENNDKVVDKVNWETMLLKKENSQLKENWNKLKEWASNFYNSEEVGWAGCGMRYTLEKIQELEGSNNQ